MITYEQVTDTSCPSKQAQVDVSSKRKACESGMASIL